MRSKVTVVGAGNVGATTALRISQLGYADLVLVDADPTKVELSGLKDIRAVMTMVGGQVVWSSGL